MKKHKDGSKCSIVAADTNLLITMCALDENYVPKAKDSGFNDKIRMMKRKCINGTLMIVVTPTVLNEIGVKMTKREEEFLRKHCLVLKPKSKDDFCIGAFQLAKEYTKSGVMDGPNDFPNFDSIILAEATLAGLNLVTNNTKDFFEYSKYKQLPEGSTGKRNLDIERFNENLGISYVTRSNVRYVPRPYTSQEFMELYRTNVFDLRPAKEMDIEIVKY